MDAITMNFAKLLQYDKDAFFKRCAQYEVWYALAEIILEGGLTNTIAYRISDDRVKVFEEFLDFIDGNGFKITELDSLNGLKKFEIHAVG